jgi:flagellar biosynthesis/type III secretory pathway chaperone
MEQEFTELAEAFDDEVACMREMLSSFEQEQAAILQGDSEALTLIVKERDTISQKLVTVRVTRQELIQKLGNGEPILELLKGRSCADSIRIVSLREQLLELILQVRALAERNNYLMEGKVTLTKEMIRRLMPSEENGTYGKDGTVGKRRGCAVALINREV